MSSGSGRDGLSGYVWFGRRWDIGPPAVLSVVADWTSGAG
jgi:hypothetical protein